MSQHPDAQTRTDADALTVEEINRLEVENNDGIYLRPRDVRRLVAMARRAVELEELLAYDEIHEAYVRKHSPAQEAASDG